MPSPPKVPQGPSAQTTAQQQTQANINAAAASQRASMVDQSNPFANLSYVQSGTGPGGIPTYKANLNYTPEQQALLDQLNRGKTTAGTAGADLIAAGNYGQAPDLGTGTDSRVTQRLGQASEYFNPVFTTQTDQLDTQLRNQGLVPGMQGYDRAIRDLRDTQNRTVSNFISEFQPQAFQQSVQEWQLPALMGMQLGNYGAPVDISTGMVNAPGATVQPTNMVGIANSAYQNQLSAYDRQKSQYDQMISGLLGMGSTIAAPFLGPIGGAITGIMGGAGNAIANNIAPVGGSWLTNIMQG